MPCRLLTLLVLGTSLAPQIPDHTLLHALPLECATPLQARDLVFFQSGARNIPIIKRVIGLPGDRFIVTDGGVLLLNGEPARNSSGERYEFPEARARMLRLYEQGYHGVIPSDAYLVLGEAVHGSTDSSIYGLISRRDILGKVTR